MNKDALYFFIIVTLGFILVFRECNNSKQREHYLADYDNELAAIRGSNAELEHINGILKQDVSTLRDNRDSLKYALSDAKSDLLRLSRKDAIKKVAAHVNLPILVNVDSSFTLPPSGADSINLAYAERDYLRKDKVIGDSIIVTQAKIIINDSLQIDNYKRMDTVQVKTITHLRKANAGLRWGLGGAAALLVLAVIF